MVDYLIIRNRYRKLTQELDSYYKPDLIKSIHRLTLNHLAYVNITGNKDIYDAVEYSFYKVHGFWGVDCITKQEIDNFF